MMNWLASSKTSKRKEPSTREKDEESKAKRKSAGGLEHWLKGANKKPKTN